MADTPSKPAPKGWVPSDDGAAGGKLHMPATDRNTAPILAALADIAPERGRALELASGSGQHAIAFAGAFPGIDWLPSERDPAGLASIEAWRADSGHGNLLAPVAIDLDEARWHDSVDGPLDLIVASNLLHISPWPVTLNLLAGAAELLADSGTLFVYGCFSRKGDYVSDSNRRFDEGLRARDPGWGVRDTHEVATAGAERGLRLVDTIPMPANNTVVIFSRGADQPASSSS